MKPANTLIAFALFGFAVSSSAQTLRQTISLNFDGAQSLQVSASAVDSQLFSIHAGRCGTGIFVRKLDRFSNLEWMKVLPSTTVSQAGVVQVLVGSNDEITVLVTDGAFSSQVLRLDANGNLLFSHTASDNGSMAARKMVLDGAGNTYVLAAAGFRTMAAFKLSSVGARLWTFVDTDTADPVGIHLTPGGDVAIIGGNFAVSPDTLDVFATRVSSLLGTVVSKNSFNFGNTLSLSATDMATDGAVWLVGTNKQPTNTQGFVARLNPDLNTLTTPTVTNIDFPTTILKAVGNDLVFWARKTGVNALIKFVSSNGTTARVDLDGTQSPSQAVFDLANDRVTLIGTKTNPRVARTQVVRLSTMTILQSPIEFALATSEGVNSGALASDGAVYAGTSDGLSSKARRFNLSSQLWARSFENIGPLVDTCPRAVTDASGNLYVLCQSSGALASGLQSVVRFNRDGTRSWTTSLPAGCLIGDMDIDATGLVLTGSLNADMFLNRLSIDNGAVVFSRTFDFDGESDIIREAVISNGELFTVGEVGFTSNGGPDIAFGRFSATTGDSRFIRIFDGLDHSTEFGTDIALMPNGNLAIGGMTSASGEIKVVVQVYTPAGQRVWNRYLTGSDTNGFDEVIDLLVAADNSVTVGVRLDEQSVNDFQGFVRMAGSNGADLATGGFTRDDGSFAFLSQIRLNSVGNPVMVGTFGGTVITVSNKNTGAVFLRRQVPDAIGVTGVLDAQNNLFLFNTDQTNDSGVIDRKLVVRKMTSTGTISVLGESNPPGNSLNASAQGILLGFSGDLWAFGFSPTATEDINGTILRFGTTNAPIARNDEYSVAEDTVLSVGPVNGVPHNDEDPDGDVMTAELVQAPPASRGSVVLNGNGGFTFTPAPNYNGTVTFTYRERDDSGALSNLATVTVTVTPVPDAPIATSETFTVKVGQTLDVAAPGLLANDFDPDRDPLTAQFLLGSQVGGGALSLAPNGSFSFVAPATPGSTTFLYKAKDSTGLLSGQKRVTLNIVP